MTTPHAARLFNLRVLLACFLSGITSLVMELSLLREFVYVVGSTSSANSFVISLFLVGLALGAYAGHALSGRFTGRAWVPYVAVQLLNGALILLFILTKNWFVYAVHFNSLVYVYFGVFSLIPAAASGISFSLFIASLYEHGRRFVAHVYAISTIGNVAGGLLQGFVLLPYYGMKATYVVALAALLVSVALMARPRALAAVSVAACIVPVLVIPRHNWFVPFEGTLLFEKDDPNGTVIAARADHMANLREDNQIAVYIGGPTGFNCSTFTFDRQWKRASVESSMKLLGRPGGRWLLLGFCSGESVRLILEADPTATVDVVEMNEGVLEMAQAVFPENWAFASTNPRAHIIRGEFRSTLRFAPASTIYDVVMVDLTLPEPTNHGIFTREFFEAIHQHLAPDGLLFSHFPEYGTTALTVFKHAYAQTRPGPYMDAQRFYVSRDIDAQTLSAVGLADEPPFVTRVMEDHGPLAL